MATFKYFYIGSRQVYIEISPQLASTLDESLDNLSVTEKANDIENPYTPFQRFYIKDENNNTIQTFIISNDNVELVTQNPARYKHRLTLVQESEYLTKHEIRNTVFSNDQDNQITKYVSASVYAKNMKDVDSYVHYDTDAFDYVSDKINAEINLESKTINSMYIVIKFGMQKITGEVLGEAHYLDMQYETPSNWNGLYTNALHEPTYYPSIRFTIGNDYRDQNISSSELNGSRIKIDDSILNWIKTFNTGTLSISIQNVDTTFMDSTAFVNQPGQDNPWFVNLSYVLEISLGSIDYNIYSVIDTLLKQQMKETEDYNSSNDSTHIKPLFKLPTPSHNPDLYNLLKETQVPNLIFTQCTMYDALAEIFKLFDAIFTIDNDGYLDIEYFNEQAQTPISQPNKAGQGRSLSEDRFTNKLITYFQNTKMEHKFPNSNNENSLAYLRSKTLGVPGESDYVFIVPKPIDIIKKVKIKAPIKFTSNNYLRYSGTVHYLRFGNPSDAEPLDITPFVIEETIWSMLPNGQPPIDNNWANPGKYNSLNYKRGNNYIDVSGYQTNLLSIKTQTLNWLLKSVINCLMGIGSTQNEDLIQDTTIDWRNVKMAVEYIALVDGKLVNESLDNKYNGETLINQSNGSIDINKLGLNMVGLSLKLGQPTLNMTQVFTSWDNRVRKGQYFVDGNGDRWVANNCVYTVIKPDLVQTNIEFVKNFNGLAKRIELNSEKRLSNISNELTTKCEETYGEYIYYSSKLITATLREKIVMYKDYLVNAIPMGFGYYTTNTDRIEYALVGSFDKNNHWYNLNGIATAFISIPLMVYGAGNSVSFEMSFDSPISGGNQLLDNYTSDLWDGGWFSRAVLYADTDGTVDNFTIDFVKMDEELTRQFPKMRKNSGWLSHTVLGKLSHFKYYKKPNEIFALNYQLHFLPISKSRDFLSNEYIKNNGFGNGLNNKQMFIRTSDNENIYSILDTKGEGDEPVAVSSIVSYPSQGNFRLKMVFSANLPDGKWASCKSWAIVDKDNNIYFASNNPPSQSDDSSVTTNQFAIWFIARHHRLS